MKLQAATRLQVTAAKGDAKAFRDALLKAGVRISNADELVYQGEYNAAKQEMAEALKEISKGFTASMKDKAKVTKGKTKLIFNEARKIAEGGVTWDVDDEVVGIEFTLGSYGEDYSHIGLLLSTAHTPLYEFSPRKFDLAKYVAYVSRAIDNYEKNGFGVVR
jgi:hypothetical protein